MNLKKRDCPIKIKLTPLSALYLLVELEISGKKHRFRPSTAVGYHFLAFTAAVYQLYSEGVDCHNDAMLPNLSYGKQHRKYCTHKEGPCLHDGEISAETSVEWDEEGPTAEITLYRKVQNGSLDPVQSAPDPIRITICPDIFADKTEKYIYDIDGKDLCYAVAKAGTEALKTYGFHGYFYSTGEDLGVDDWIDINQLLFFKAYALGVMEVREFTETDPGGKTSVFATDFNKELELLLFDM